MSQEMQQLVSILEELDQENLVLLIDLAQAMKNRQNTQSKNTAQKDMTDAQKAFQDMLTLSRKIDDGIEDEREAIHAHWTEKYETAD
jgi:hypothetical protein